MTLKLKTQRLYKKKYVKPIYDRLNRYIIRNKLQAPDYTYQQFESWFLIQEYFLNAPASRTCTRININEPFTLNNLKITNITPRYLFIESMLQGNEVIRHWFIDNKKYFNTRYAAWIKANRPHNLRPSIYRIDRMQQFLPPNLDIRTYQENKEARNSYFEKSIHSVEGRNYTFKMFRDNHKQFDSLTPTQIHTLHQRYDKWVVNNYSKALRPHNKTQTYQEYMSTASTPKRRKENKFKNFLNVIVPASEYKDLIIKDLVSDPTAKKLFSSDNIKKLKEYIDESY